MRHLFIWILLVLSYLDGPLALAEQAALIVLDMQESFIHSNPNHKLPENVAKKNELIARQIAAIHKAKANGLPVLFIEYKGHGPIVRELLEAAENYDRAIVLEKTEDSLFSDSNRSLPEVLQLLEAWNVSELVVMGANGGACVYFTIWDGLRRKFNIRAYSAGIADFNTAEFRYPYIYPEYKVAKFNERDMVFRQSTSARYIYHFLGHKSFGH